MRNFHPFIGAVLLTLLAGCAAPMRPVEFSLDIQLQDPLPGHTVAYLIRAPHDSADIELSIDGERVALLAAETYTVVKLKAGEHRISAVTRFMVVQTENAQSLIINASPDRRRFFYMSINRETSTGVGLISIKGIGLLPILSNATRVVGPRHWTEAEEGDARGLLSIAKVVLPARDAF